MSTLHDLRERFTEQKKVARSDLWTLAQLEAVRINFEPFCALTELEDRNGASLYQVTDLRIKFGAAHPSTGKLVTQLALTERMALRHIWSRCKHPQARAFIQTILCEDAQVIAEYTKGM